jgi:hypothetical protein
MQNSPQLDLFDILVTHNFEPKMKDAESKDVYTPDDAKMFWFDWKSPTKNYGTTVILLGENQTLTVFFGDNLGQSMDSGDKDEWYDFLEQMKNFSVRNFLQFSTQNINKLKYTMQGMAAIKEGLFEGYYGNKKYSFSDQPKQVKLVIKHNKTLGEGDKRYRNIESLFVETADGERFKVPKASLMHGKMIARHVSEGGNPYDTFGQHISEVVTEMATLAKFVRAARNKNFSDEARALAETAIRHYNSLKAKAKRIISRRGYHQELEGYDPAEVTHTNRLTDSIRNMFIEQNLDSRIEEALPILAKLSEPAQMKETDEFESWANNVTEGTWSLPDTPAAESKLRKLMAEPLIVGADAMNATEQLYDLVGDDQLFDILDDIATADARANIWEDERVMARLEELGIDVSTVGQSTDDQDTPAEEPPQDEPSTEEPAPTSEDLDTDGVMMTKPSNMSSESVERVIRLAQLLR